MAPGSTKTLGVQGLTHLGIYQMPFTNWSVWVKSKGTTPCAYGYLIMHFLIQADGSILPDPCGTPAA